MRGDPPSSQSPKSPPSIWLNPARLVVPPSIEKYAVAFAAVEKLRVPAPAYRNRSAGSIPRTEIGSPFRDPSRPDPSPRTSSTSWATTAIRSYLAGSAGCVRSLFVADVFRVIVPSRDVTPPLKPRARTRVDGRFSSESSAVPGMGWVGPAGRDARAVASSAVVARATRAAR